MIYVLSKSCFFFKEFLSLTSRWAFVNSNAVVKFFGLTLSSPISMVTEYLSLGQLDHYLENVDNHIPVKEVDLVEAATYLANALWYLVRIIFMAKLSICICAKNNIFSNFYRKKQVLCMETSDAAKY